MSLPDLIGGVLVAFLVIYSLTGGADFGGGTWDLLAGGPRAGAQRKLIATALGPIWEANHVWLIAMIVILFVAFPSAFAVLSTALHIPLTVMLLGIVLRGSAFVFRKYDRPSAEAMWSRIFAIASMIAPLMLGVCLGALSSGTIRLDEQGRWHGDFVSAWWHPFPWIVGLFTLALFAFLAAVYLTGRTRDPELQRDFGKRALVSGLCVGALALAGYLVASRHAPFVAAGLTGRSWSFPLQLLTGLNAVATLWCLWRGNYRLARLTAPAQVALIVLGWAFLQYPYLIFPDVTVTAAAAPSNILRLTLQVLAGGSALMIPSFIYLFHLFAFQKDGS